jgi:hypothetical protein
MFGVRCHKPTERSWDLRLTDRKRIAKQANGLRNGGRGRNRTFNLSVKSRMLCQLSYAPLSLAPWRSPPQNEG